MAPLKIPADFDFLDPDVNLAGLPVAELAELRKSEPIHWVAVPSGCGGFEDHGYWMVSKHADVKEVSRRSDVFSSWENGAIPVWPQEMKRDMVEMQRSVMLNMDAPHHTRLRKIISRGFTPRAIGRLEEELSQRAQNIVKAAAAEGSGDFVEQVSCELPLQAIAGLLGVPQEDRDKLFRWSNEMTGGEDPEFADVDPAQSSMEVIMYAMAMADKRGKNPTDDIVTALIQADIDGEKLSDDEFGFFVIMLAVAGNETTRNSITHGMIAMASNPDQWELFKKERPTTAADEIIRWATPVSAFQRTANEDTELAGVQIKKGQRLVMSYRSANFDEDVFEHAHTFDILRDPNPHVGFGGTGAHFCIGANLARMTINLIFNAVADHMPDLKAVGEPERLRSGWLNGIKHWQVDYTGAGAGAGEPANSAPAGEPANSAPSGA
jgi:cholest-4-en-3-one 26-monooxygenase